MKLYSLLPIFLTVSGFAFSMDTPEPDNKIQHEDLNSKITSVPYKCSNGKIINILTLRDKYQRALAFKQNECSLDDQIKIRTLLAKYSGKDGMREPRQLMQENRQFNKPPLNRIRRRLNFEPTLNKQ